MKVRYLIIPFLLIAPIVTAPWRQDTSDLVKQETSCSEKSSKLMILGVYHMGNPGQDVINIQADDVLAPKRQREIAELLDKLARFRPTKIAIEAAYRSTAWTSRYDKFLKGEYQLGRNEIEQIGFQLAKRLGHTTLYPVDFPMWMNGLQPNERDDSAATPTPAASATPKPQPTPTPPLPPHLAKHEELMRRATVTEILLHLNSEEYARADHASYMDMLLPNNNVAIYGRTDLLTNWYKRNLRIFTNLNRITEFGKDRVLLIIGSGHLNILRDFAIDAPYFCLVDTNVYLK